MRELFDTSIERLLTDLVTPELLRQSETGVWPTALWHAIEESGFLVAAAPEALGGAGAGWDELYGVVRAAGQHSLPAPLPEGLLANALLARCGLEARNEALTVAPASTLVLQAGRVHGQLQDVPWARHAAHVVAIVGGAEPSLVLLDPKQAQLTAQQNTAGEARDQLAFDGVKPMQMAALPAGLPADTLWLGGAMLRSAQTAGALEAALSLSVGYATERVQFGKPISAFQAIQHQLAQMAEQTGCTAVAAEAAFADSVDAFSLFGIATAKVVAAEAAGSVAAMAHTVHGAIGFTHEHALQHLTRRLWSWRSEFGNLSHWSQRLGSAVCAGGSASLWPMVTAGALATPPQHLNQT